MPSPACRSSMLLTIVALLAATLTGARSLANPPSEIAKKVVPSVVLVTTEDDQGEALARGSGFVVAEGVIATNLHVIRGASKAFVKVVNSETQLEVLGIVAENNEWDLVLLAVKDLTAPPLPLGDSTALQVGDDVYAVGNPHGLEGTFSAGIISSIRRIEGDALLQITAPISPGSSGGPIVNEDAQVVGVATLAIVERPKVGFAGSSSFLADMIASLNDEQPLTALRALSTEVERTEPPRDVYWIHIVEWMNIRAEVGDAEAMAILGGLYANGSCVEHDDGEAVRWYRDAAELGDAGAMSDLAFMYAVGRGVSKDESEAARWYHLAAMLGHATAASNLGLMYANGQGVETDYSEAVSWYRRAADMGHAAGMFNLGFMYAQGKGVPRDDREAVGWYRKAANLRFTEAMFNLALMYADGRGVVQDDREAVKWYRAAAELGSAVAMSNLGLMYAGGRGVLQDDGEAVAWCRKAADLGEVGAMATLGFMYANGRGVAKDDEEAAKWYRKAADLGNAMAASNLGLMYANGRGVQQSDQEAVLWYRKAANLGHAAAMANLGGMYALGKGVAQDDIEAYAWLSTAVALGSQKAIEGRDFVANRLTPGARLTAQALAKQRLEEIEKALKK